MERGKKGQAAMEFLMTYGWAILAAVVVIAVLASFGVFSPSKYVPTSCIMTAPWGCDKNQIAANNSASTVTLQIINGGGQTYDNVIVSLTGDCVGSNAEVDDWADGTSTTVVITCATAPTAGSKVSGDISIAYSVDGGTIPLASSGSYTVEAVA
ncbi:hypothetical protein COU55_02085 [Candidatus Pacearchaeota archaeon CG10_big_fil_rev_8_21_14_0_10_31_59]|nr:MAG: hypothetical protein COU55_02085 [Candidatus Pacearchaeota archaeon CG10_big_fil_rev_8_21_14_0_10_31_59]